MRTMMMVVLVVGLVLGGMAFGQKANKDGDAERARKIVRKVAAQGPFENEEEYFQRIVSAFKEELGTEHPVTLVKMTELAIKYNEAGDYANARAMFEEILEVRQQVLGADHPDTLNSMHNLAITLKAQGDLLDAQKIEVKVLEARQQTLGDEHPDTLKSKYNLAKTSYLLGDVQVAREIYEEILEIQRRELGAVHPNTLKSAVGLAVMLKIQGNIQAAREMEEEILQIQRQRLGAEHPDTLTSMGNLAITMHAHGDFQSAREMEEKILATRRRILGDEHPDTLATVRNLAATLYAQGDFQGAREMEEPVLEVLQRKFAGHPHTLTSMHNLANTLLDLNDLEGARILLGELVDTRRKTLGPNQYLRTLVEFKSLARLGAIYRDLHDYEQAAQRYLQALDALESQTRKYAAEEGARSNFKAQWHSAYRDTLEILLDLGRKNEAHHVLERFRAQGLLSMLAERDVVLAEMPTDLEERRRDLDEQYDRTVFVRDKLNPNRQKEAFAAVLKEQKALRRQRERLKVELRSRAPAVADIEYSQTLAADQIRPILEPGTLMLSFMVGPEKTYLFALSRMDDIVILEIDIDETTLWKQIVRFHEQLGKKTAAKTHASASKMASWLYGKFLGDVSKQIAKSTRLLIVPDGPLSYIPFAALIGPDEKYLVESKAVHSVVSATVYAELQKRRRTEDARRPVQMAAFGNSSYPKGNAPVDETVSRAIERKIFDGGLTPLPHSGHEVKEIGRLYQSELYLGSQATEEKAKALDADVGIVHLAAHGLADPITPLDSFIALSVTNEPKRDNGLLQAWEIYERMRLGADLVVLSACQTAFGPELGGEGLLSLSRAFQVAGARAVVASLWSVADESTAEFMIRFYKHLRGDQDTPGKTTDEALRAAQLELLQGPVTFTDTAGNVVRRDFSSPYYWAAFQVIGDWK